MDGDVDPLFLIIYKGVVLLETLLKTKMVELDGGY